MAEQQIQLFGFLTVISCCDSKEQSLNDVDMGKKELESDGFYPEAWMWMGFVLVPVYLVIREIKATRNFVPAIIWCFLFAIVTFVL